MAKKCSDLFLVLVLYFVFIQSTKSSLSQYKISPIDFNALRDIKNQLTDFPSQHFFSTWNFSSPDPCSSFQGVTCSSSGKVTVLALGTGLSDSPGLAGILSPSIAKLTQLNQLILFAGIVTGPIPPQIASLKNLRVISLTNNRLHGAIPTQIFTLPNLHTLDLSHNHLSGSIPPTISGLTQLKVLILGSNRLSGLLPGAFPDQLLHLDLSSNDFSGTLPRQLPTALRYLSVAQNHMWGPLNGLEVLSYLVYLDLSMNQLSGPIPPSLFRPTLNSMLLQRNNLSGRVPQASPTTYVLGSGTIVDLSHNFLTGELTPALIGVETLFLNNNHLTGAVPKEYVDSINTGSMKTLYLQHNYITGFPLEAGRTLPDSISVCLSYNCMVPPVGLTACPASAGEQLSRPSYQCSAIRNDSSSFD
ncbi:Leucine-rich repeat (LRR) family protein [Abeliophyllum distichum]|uniref:Leucine-rich repeat (LRR) family protein n=1 Tax=Abeliophyllum distichum TaxID=126358 RepID=A0ABD1QDP6_9LAMI